MDKKQKRNIKKQESAITLIALVVTIVVLLILAAVSISMLTGDNGIIKKASDAKDKTEQAKVEELVTIAINSLIAENQGDRSQITPDDISTEVNRMENRTDVTAESNTFPTNILFPKEDREVGVNIDLAVTDPIEQEIYSVPVEESQIAPDDLFDYEIISNAQTGSIKTSKLPTKTARITRIKPQYCNDNGYNPETSSNDFGDTNYAINYKGTIISDTLVIPNRVEIDGEMYRITEINLYAGGSSQDGTGYTFPKVETVIYPNTIEKIYGKMENADVWRSTNSTLKNVIFSNRLKEIGKYSFKGCINLDNIIIPSNVISIEDCAFFKCDGLTSVIISNSVTSIGKNAFYRCIGLTSITIPNSITSIGYDAFNGCTSLTTVNYTGTEEQWKSIDIDSSNTNLTNATINYNYTGE